MKKVMPTKLLWIDLEMTGLNPETQKIIEVAAIVTDFDLNEVASYSAIIMQDDEVLDNAEEWPKSNMSELFQLVRNSDKQESTVIGELHTLIKKCFGDEPAILAGNSIHQDRKFITKWWPQVDNLLHYRMLDVSTLKVILQGKTGDEGYQKQEVHRAMDDIKESIAELKWSLGELKNL